MEHDRDLQALRIKRNLIDSQKKLKSAIDARRRSSIEITQSVLSQCGRNSRLRDLSRNEHVANSRTQSPEMHQMCSSKATATTVVMCQQHDCHRVNYKDGHCKHHFAKRVKREFRSNFKNMYRGPEQAFNVLDFTGKGYILAEDILNSPVMRRIRYTRTDVEFSFKMLNLFNNVSVVSAIKDGVPPNGMSFDKFREIFFPQLHILEEENQSDEDKNIKEMER